MYMHHEAAPVLLPCACTTLRKASRAVARVYDDALAGTGMNVTQFAILRAIARAGSDGVALSRLADAMVMDRTSLYRALQPLERAGWIAIAAAGARAERVLLSEAGCTAIEAAAPRWEAAQTAVVEVFGIDRWQALHGSIAELAQVGVGMTAQRFKHVS